MTHLDKNLALGEQLVQGLKQLEMNIKTLHKLHALKGLDTTAPYTTNTEDLLKLAFVNDALKGLKR